MHSNKPGQTTYGDLIKRFRWLFAFHWLHHVYLLLLPPLFPLLRESIVPSYTLLGTLRGVLGIMGFLMLLWGRLSDRLGEQTVILLEFSLIPVFLVLASFASSYSMLLLFVAGFGVVKCIYHPAGLSYLSKVMDKNIEGKTIGLHESLGSLGSGLSFIMVGILGQWLGWRYALIAMTIPSLLLLLLYFLLGGDISEKKPESPSGKKNPDSKDGSDPPQDSKAAFGIKAEKLSAFYFQIGGNIAGGLGRGGFVTFLASFLVQIYGLSAGMAGSLVGISYLGGFLGNLLGGRISDRIGLVHAYGFFTGLAVLFATLVVVFEFSLPLLFLLLLSFFLLFTAANPADKALLAKHSHTEGRSTGYGSLFTSYTVSAVISGPFFGFLIESYGMRPALSLVPVLLGIATILRFQLKKYH